MGACLVGKKKKKVCPRGVGNDVIGCILLMNKGEG